MADLEKKEKMRSVTIRKAENGYIGSCSYEPEKTKNGMMYESDKEYALVDRDAALKFVEKALGGGKGHRVT